MAKTKRELIFGACILSGIATVLNIVSLGTQQWVNADLRDIKAMDNEANVNYGLFAGDMFQRVPQPKNLKLQITCLMAENVCALMSGSSDHRYSSLKKIYKDRSNDTNLCGSDEYTTDVKSLKLTVSGDTASTSDPKYINAGVWICAIMFLCLSALLGLVSSCLALWNTTANPVEAYFNIFGLYIYNGIASFTVLMTLILWGAEFAASISENVACCWSLVIDSKAEASLGYSYWLNLPAMFFYAGSVAVLYGRQYLIDKEPTVNVHLEGEVDPGIYLY